MKVKIVRAFHRHQRSERMTGGVGLDLSGAHVSIQALQFTITIKRRLLLEPVKETEATSLQPHG